MQMNLFSLTESHDNSAVVSPEDWIHANPLIDANEKNGVVYTKAWVVDLILDLAGYTSDQDLASFVAVEPSAGKGAFLLPMAKRLIHSCTIHHRPITDSQTALLSYELDVKTASFTRASLETLLVNEGVRDETASDMALRWIKTGDYLSEPNTLPRADFVIGNPPYIRLEDINPTLASFYRNQFPTMTGRADLYIAFFEAALNQLKQNGVCAFICADRWMLNQYGAELRRTVTRRFGVEAVIEMHTADAFYANVSAYPAITVIRRSPQGPAVVANADPCTKTIDGEAVAHLFKRMRASHHQVAPMPAGIKAARIEEWFQGTDPWPCVSPERLALLKRLEKQFPLLESPLTKTIVGIGVATGCDEVFITTDSNIVEPDRLLPLAMAADHRNGQFRWGGHYLIDPWQNSKIVDLADFPKLAACYEMHRARLLCRNVGQKNPEKWYRTIDRVNHWLLPKQKLYIPDIKDRLRPFLDKGTTYPHHNLYFVQSETWDMEVLGGILMSALGQFFVECYGVRMRGGYFRFQAQYLRRIRVPDPALISHEQAWLLADAFRRRDVEGASHVAFDLYCIDGKARAALGY